MDTELKIIIKRTQDLQFLVENDFFQPCINCQPHKPTIESIKLELIPTSKQLQDFGLTKSQSQYIIKKVKKANNDKY